MNRKSFLMGLSAAGIAPLTMGFGGLSTSAASAASAGAPQMLVPELKNSYWYIGHLMSILLSAKDTGGAFALIHGFEIKGLEPPPHIHTLEDESFYLLDGEINYTAGNELFSARKGNWVFLPKGIQHSFQVVTDQAEVLIHLSPGGFENYFIEMSEPAPEMVIPTRPQGPPDVKRIIETASKYGVRFPGLA